jgi:hypothetical protein
MKRILKIMLLCAAVVLGASCGKDMEIEEYKPKKRGGFATTDALGGNHADEKFMDGTGVDTNLDVVAPSNEKEINADDPIDGLYHPIGLEVSVNDWADGMMDDEKQR